MFALLHRSVEVTYDDASDAGGSEGPVTKAGNACKCACVGVLIFFGCLFMLAWNERNFVCTNKVPLSPTDSRNLFPASLLVVLSY